jgi:hypothetical protein
MALLVGEDHCPIIKPFSFGLFHHLVRADRRALEPSLHLLRRNRVLGRGFAHFDVEWRPRAQMVDPRGRL